MSARRFVPSNAVDAKPVASYRPMTMIPTVTSGDEEYVKAPVRPSSKSIKVKAPVKYKPKAHIEGTGTATGEYSHAIGTSSVSGDYSFAGGQGGLAAHTNAFIWTDGTTVQLTTGSTSAIKQFIVNATGSSGNGIKFYNGATGSPVSSATQTIGSNTTWTYIPGIPANWPSVPSNVADALDDLANIVKTNVVNSIMGTANQIAVSAVTGDSIISIVSNPILPGTADVTIPSGTTGQRPGAPTDAMFRFNTTEEIFEGYASEGSGNYTGTYTPFSDVIGIPKTIIYRKRRVWVDDFMSTQGYGELGWYVNGTGTWSNTFNVATADHPGQITLSISGSASDHVTLALSGSPTIGNIMANQISYFSFILNTPSITTAVLATNVGIGDQISNDNRIGNNSVFFSFFPSVSPNILFYTQSGSNLSTAILTAALVANRWYLCEAWTNASGTTWYCAVNGVNYGGISTNIPTVAVTPGINNQTLNGAAMTIVVDYFSMITKEMGNRYP